MTAAARNPTPPSTPPLYVIPDRSLFLLLVLAGCAEHTPEAASVAASSTQSTRSRSPESVTSPSGDLVAFRRGTPDRLVESLGPGMHEATEIWTSKPDGSDEQLLVRGDEGHSDLHNLQFSPDGQQLYYLSTGWVTSHALHAVAVHTGERRYVCPGSSFEVLRDGTHGGHLIVEQHRYYPMGGSYDSPWLFTPDGKCLGPVAQGPGGGIDPGVLRQCLERPARSPRRGSAQAGRTGG